MNNQITVKTIRNKSRKITDGPVRNKERTKQKFIDAVGKIFETEGYTGLNAKKIAETAKVDRKLLYLYFGNLDNLIKSFFSEKDYWKAAYKKEIEGNANVNEQNILNLLKGQLDSILDNKEFQRIIHWEISEKSEIMKIISNDREMLGQKLFHLTAEYFRDRNIDFPAALAIQIGGIYYVALHSKINGSTFCGININIPEGRKRILKELEYIVGDFFKRRKLGI